MERRQVLRYGENPQQTRRWLGPRGVADAPRDGVKRREGKELSFDNLLDLGSAPEAAEDFDGPAVGVIVKRNNHCSLVMAHQTSKPPTNAPARAIRRAPTAA